MDELDKGLAISLRGPEGTKALEAFRQQMQSWEVALPPTDLLVLDFGLGDFASVGLIESWICNEVGAGYCSKYLFVFDGQSCPMHRHREKHETFLVVQGRVRMTCGGEVREMAPGDVLAVEPGLVHGFTGMGPALLLEISKPCVINDNYFEDMRIPIGGNYRREQ